MSVCDSRSACSTQDLQERDSISTGIAKRLYILIVRSRSYIAWGSTMNRLNFVNYLPVSDPTRIGSYTDASNTCPK